ncbi:phenylalanine--tRNA ligase subunit beta [Sphingopyxis alaskensis]|jgi:phenylalanyl-tRNA synthetase beta chain|uniref:Phenylalanine--tRNA ligase beta subunit n=1 Tax=Sphingopyxis alaskensis (strain DSM 13593 / LMG 18877 / RB2256) TaxID=317655 RepID=Q1GPD4_SPHAL|nr:phenylalanine--tRNA ligase subunit beta [Sphingopyxis alaskensis]ABF54488.1 phenylalanyl-tRNA synthetase beta subunit [Sphingopyxis alaskensis RB2256]MCM3417787.1 phenylalanine--tRNA ligase subunit beta [Sphingopyxis alaskensis]
MKLTLDWLKDHLDGDFTVEDVVATLNRIGHEVEGVENPADKLAGFRVARVLTAEKHPQADKLQVLTVEAGPEVNAGAPLTIVCGAPNARAGLVGVLGLPGAVVPASGMALKVAAVRGVESNGMMCSSRELELGDDHDGIIELPEDAPVGASFADYRGAGDPVIDISITPNRQDCMGVRGLARDLAAAGLGTLKPLDVPTITGDGAPATEIRTDDPEGCPAFYGRTISGVTNGTAPEWMRRRLEAVGQRSISALVDISNYVMFDLGRPSHIYDRAKLSGPLVARRAKAGETVTALNGKDYTLADTMTVIADDRGVHDIAGIMGGEHSGCSAATSDVLIEVAYFTPERIALTGQALGLTSDARSRFERGVDPAFLDDATAIVTAHVLAICGGTPSTVTRAGTPPVGVKTVDYDPALSATLGGVVIAPERQKEILTALGFTVIEQGGRWRVQVPSWRRDIDGAADLVEEVTRIHGFDTIASVALPRADGVAKPTATAEQLLERRVRRAAAAAGFHEAVTWSFISEQEAAPFGGGDWSLANPISEELKVMRPSLLPGLLAAAARNQKRGADSIRLFEIGRRYLSDAEHPTLAVLMAGDKRARGWQAGKAAPFDAFDAKAAALALLDAAGAPAERLQVMDAVSEGSIWHPGQSATLRLGPKAVLAEFGALHPALTRHFDVGGPAMAVQIFLDAIPAKRASGPARAAFAPPALQSVRRDFAFLAPTSLTAAELVRAIRGADKASIVDARLFDRFTGQGVPEGQVSLAVEVELQPMEKSFTDAELKAIADKVVAAAAKVGAVLRG